MKLPSYRSVLPRSAVALTTSLIMAFYATAMSSGLTADFVEKWIQAYAVAVVVSVPFATVISPKMLRVANRIISNPPATAPA